MKTKNSTHVVLDSSVIAKWFFPTEEDSENALKVKEDLLSGKIMISVPLLVYYEVNNLIRTAIKSLRVDEKLAKEAYQGFLELGLVAYSSRDLMKTALSKAIDLNISSYDASYLTLAESLKVPLFTADRRLISQAKGEFVRDIKEYDV